MTFSISWNAETRLILSDVDETVADLYLPAEPAMIQALTRVLTKGVRFVFITGQSIANVEQRVVSRLPASLRRRVAVGACSGAELWGYSPAGNRNSSAFYTAENNLSDEQKKLWRGVVRQLLAEFKLVPHPPMPLSEFAVQHGTGPLHVMVDDRGPQITIEFLNAYDLPDEVQKDLAQDIGHDFEERDLRMPVLRRAQTLLNGHAIPVTPRLAGIFALDFAISGISKTHAVVAALTPAVLKVLGIEHDLLQAREIEIWGDRFSHRAGTDWLMCVPIDHGARAISFRKEDRDEFPAGFNICLWDGERHLQEGLLEYLNRSV